MKKKYSYKDIVVVGFALFAMFFGAGNLIFPPALGLITGNKWIEGFLLYFIADIGLASLAVYTLIGTDGNPELINEPLGKIPSRIIITMIFLCIGPCFGIPRTAATTYELGVLPLLNIEVSKFDSVIFSVIFFAIVLFLSIKPNKVVDIIGKVLTPILLACITIMIVKGIIDPPALIGKPLTSSVAREGIYNGYQTMDMLAALAVTIIIIASVKDKGYKTEKEMKRVTLNSTFLAAILLFAVYGGLTYLGATCEGSLRKEFFDGYINQATLLTAIIKKLLGFPGLVVMAIVVASACLTTAIGAASAVAEYFQKFTKLSYEKLIIILCVASMLVCNLGLSAIIAIAGPILQILYPVAVIMIATFFLRKKITNVWPYRVSVIVALIISLVEVAADIFGISNAAIIMIKSFSGFAWVIPSIIAFVITYFLVKKRRLV